jgi:hypothetical protein
MALDIGTVNRALKARGARGGCPACNQGPTWGLVSGAILLPHIEGDKLKNEGTEAVGLVCDNCGLVRLHTRAELGV